ncbi:MAG: hypothetical protein AAGL68_02870 [Pseudomonadota bacterium]
MQAQIAQAQEACVVQQDLTDAVIYAMPVLADAFDTACSAELAPDGFFATQRQEFIAPYAALGDETWPGASRVLNTFVTAGSTGENGMPGLAEIFGNQSPETVRPFIDAMLGTMVVSEIKPKDCGKIERGLELMAPLPPENMGGLVTFLMDMAEVKNPRICPLEGE